MKRLRVLCTTLLLLASLETARADLRDGIGSTIAEIGDVDRDGVPDVGVLIRARGLLRGRYAKAFAEIERAPLVPHLAVISGANGEMLRIFPAFEEEGTFTSLVCGVGDLTGDRRAEIVVSGGGVIRCFSALTAELLWETGRELKRKRFGWNLLRVPDCNGDGTDELLSYSGPTRLNGHDAALHLLSGADGSVLQILSGQVPSAELTGPEVPFTHLTLRGDGPAEVRNLAPCRAMSPILDAQGNATRAIAFVVRWPSHHRSEPEIFERWTLQLEGFELKQEEILFAEPWGFAALGSLDGDEHSEYALTCRSDWLRVHNGSSGEALFAQSFEGGQSNGEGTSVTSLRDVNGDGVRDLLLSANEEVEDCDGGSARLYSGAEGALLWKLDLQGKNGLDLGPCGIGVDTCVCPSARDEARDDVVCHMPRLHEVRRLDGRNGAVLWRWAYDAREGTVVQATPLEQAPGKLLAQKL